MKIGRVYKLEIDNGILRDPYYHIVKLENIYMVFWYKSIDNKDNSSWLPYSHDKVEKLIIAGTWKILEEDVDLSRE